MLEIKIFNELEEKLISEGFNITNRDFTRPWGGFFVIDEAQCEIFAKQFFNDLDFKDLKNGLQLSPKILIVLPNKRLSWQYHFRRSEIWKVMHGTAGIVRSNNDNEGDIEIMNVGSQITLRKGERHRLVGLNEYAVIAEIWQHLDSNNPSNEEDIVRLQDDFGR